MKQLEQNNRNIEKCDHDFLLLLGYNYIKSTKLKKATVIYRALHKLYPKSSIYSLCLSYLYLKESDYEKAIQCAEKFIENTKGSLKHGYLLKSKALFEIGMIEEAKKCAKKIFV
jgi:tetratricopeptide (TPR) repeat protein